MSKKLKALSLFSSAGIAEFGFENSMIDVVLANELLPVRMNVHKFWHPEIKTICGILPKMILKMK
jgi:DNA (cytosine-5)-methyltransferase 1